VERLEGLEYSHSPDHPRALDTKIWDKEAEPVEFDTGKKLPPEMVSDDIFETIENRIREPTIPKRNPQLILARFMRPVSPGLMRKGMARTVGVPLEIVKRAPARRRDCGSATCPVVESRSTGSLRRVPELR